MTKVLPRTLTSYDFLKTAALLLMIVDHIGYYFYPDDYWWRAIGRMSGPIWLFLIGYAQSRDMPVKMWVGIAILFVSNYIVGQPILPFSILATMLVCRAAIDPLMGMLRSYKGLLYPVSAVLFILTFLTFPVLEYGSEAMLLVMLGYMVRNRASLPFPRSDLLFFAILVTLSHGFFASMIFFDFSEAQKMLVWVGLPAVVILLLNFKPAEYPVLTDRMPGLFAGFIRLCGRRSLEIYVLHLVIFRFAALAMGQPDYALFNLRILE